MNRHELSSSQRREIFFASVFLNTSFLWFKKFLVTNKWIHVLILQCFRDIPPFSSSQGDHTPLRVSFLTSELGTVGKQKRERQKTVVEKLWILRTWADIAVWPFAIWPWNSFPFSLWGDKKILLTNFRGLWKPQVNAGLCQPVDRWRLLLSHTIVSLEVREGRGNWAGAVREDLMEDIGLKWTLEEGKDWERQKRHSSQEELRKGLYPVGEGWK